MSQLAQYRALGGTEISSAAIADGTSAALVGEEGEPCRRMWRVRLPLRS